MPTRPTQFEREQIEARGFAHVPLGEVASDPRGAAAGALDDFAGRFDRLLVHLDVDTIDFTDAPLSENTGRNEGLALDAAMEALGVLLASERVSALTVTELQSAARSRGRRDAASASCGRW